MKQQEPQSSRVCRGCNELKSASCYDKCSRGRLRQCKACRSTKYKRRRKDRLSTIEGLLKERLTDARRRAKNKNLDFTLTYEYLLGLWEEQGGHCALSDLPMSVHSCDVGQSNNNTVVSLDRIDSNLGYTISNTQLVCVMMNTMKSNMTQQKFIEMCSLVSTKYKVK